MDQIHLQDRRQNISIGFSIAVSSLDGAQFTILQHGY